MKPNNSHEPQRPANTNGRSSRVGVFRLLEDDLQPDLDAIISEAWARPLPSATDFIATTRDALAMLRRKQPDQFEAFIVSS